MIKTPYLLILLLLAGMLLPACKIPARETPASANDLGAVFTAAAHTATAKVTEAARPTQTPIPLPTDTPDSLFTATPRPPETPFLPVIGVGGTPVQLTGAGADKAEFVNDVSVPDGTVMQPKQKFTKTWLLKNAGNSTWTGNYVLFYTSGPNLGAAPVNMPGNVAPGATVEITATLTAPAQPGKYRSYFNLRNPNGAIFGTGPGANEAIWVEITVQGSSPAVTGTPDARSTGTPGTPQPPVQNLSVSVNTPNATKCPYTFVFTVKFTLKEPAEVLYGLDAGTNMKPPPTIRLPQPVAANLPAGEQTAVFTLEFSQNFAGWVKLKFSEPAVVESAPLNFTLTCK
jgi:hypothetical protein